MQVARGGWDWLEAHGRQAGAVLGAAGAAGVALIIAAQAGGFGWMRLPGAILITVGGGGLGLLAGLAAPGKWLLRQAVEWRYVLAVIAALGMGLPVVAGLLGAVDGVRHGALAILGAVIGVVLAAAAVFAVVMSLRALGHAWEDRTGEDGDTA